MYGCESWTVKKAECQRIDAFELQCWRRLLRVPWTPRRSNQSILKEINPEYILEGQMLKLKLQYDGQLLQRTDSLEKSLTLGEIEGRRRRGQERMASLTQWTWVWAGSRRQWRTGSLVCCSPWDHIEADMAEQLNNNHTFRHGMIPACAMMSVGIVSVITSLDKRPTVQFSSVKSLSRVHLFATPWTAARQASLSISNSRSTPRLTSIELVMPSSHLILCHPLLLLPPIPPSIRVFSNESTLHMRWPKYWSFSFSIIPSQEHPVLISFRMDWLDLLAVQGTLKSLLQYHVSKT